MTEVRSFRRVFELERRIYRIDRIRLNPAGVPVRGLVYFLVLCALAMLAGSLPLLGLVVATLPWYVRALALPGATAALLTVIRLEGRPFHLAARALLGYRCGPRRLASLRRSADSSGWRAQELLVLPDGSDAALRRLRYSGPGAALITVAHERLPARAACPAWVPEALSSHMRSLTVRGIRTSARTGEVIVLRAGARLVVDPRRGVVTRKVAALRLHVRSSAGSPRLRR